MMESTVRTSAGKTLVVSRLYRIFALELIFLTIIVAVSYFKGMTVPTPEWAWPVLFAFATIRLAKTISENEVGLPIRAAFTEAKSDSCRAGENVHPKGESVLGALLSCPICTGTWAAMGLWAVWSLVPWLGTSLVFVLGMAGASEALNYTFEFTSWGGRAFRVYSGHISPDKE